MEGGVGPAHPRPANNIRGSRPSLPINIPSNGPRQLRGCLVRGRAEEASSPPVLVSKTRPLGSVEPYSPLEPLRSWWLQMELDLPLFSPTATKRGRAKHAEGKRCLSTPSSLPISSHAATSPRLRLRCVAVPTETCMDSRCRCPTNSPHPIRRTRSRLVTRFTRRRPCLVPGPTGARNKAHHQPPPPHPLPPKPNTWRPLTVWAWSVCPEAPQRHHQGNARLSANLLGNPLAPPVAAPVVLPFWGRVLIPRLRFVERDLWSTYSLWSLALL